MASRRVPLVIVGLPVLGIAVLCTTVIRFRADHAAAPSAKPAVLGTRDVAFDPSAIPVAVQPPRHISDTEPPIRAKVAYLLDAGSAYPLYAQQADQPVPIASVTKLMTAVIARKEYGLDDVLAADSAAVSVEGSKILLRTGEQMDVRSLLTGLLIQSGNDAAMTLADHMGLETFVAKMNEQAQYLGMTDTHYMDPAGLNDDGRSTARDLAVLAAYVMRDEVIRDIVSQPATTIKSADGSVNHALTSSNRLIISDNPLYLPEVTGLKTGFTYDAGHCLVATAEHNGHQLVSVILDTTSDTADASAAETRKLLLWAFGAFEWQ